MYWWAREHLVSDADQECGCTKAIAVSVSLAARGSLHTTLCNQPIILDGPDVEVRITELQRMLAQPRFHKATNYF